MTQKLLAERVTHYFQEQNPNGIPPAGLGLQVVEAEIREEKGSWYVPVLPSAQPPKMYAYYEVLAEIESALDEQDHLNVLLVPLVPEESAG